MSDDLISRSALLAKMTDRTFQSELHEYRHYQNIVKMMPTAYDVDKVLENLENGIEESTLVTLRAAFKVAIDIVKSGGIE